MKSELTPRQWALYNLLRNNPDTYFKQIDIANALKDFYRLDKNITFHDSAARILITNDIRAINNSDIIEKIIISNGSGVKLASKAEFEQYINAQFAAIFRKLERTRKKAKKAGLDGQLKFTTGAERDTVQAFTEEINRLKAARLAKGLRLVDVVKELRKTEKYVDVPLLSKIENGYCLPSKQLADKLADIYGVEPQNLVSGKVVDFDIIA